MKRFLIVLCLVLSSAAVQAQWVDKVTLYLPNRVLDLMDVFTLNLGPGLMARAELRATHAAQAGAGIGYSAKLMKDINRQYGWAAQNGWDVFFGAFAAEDFEQRPAGGSAKEFLSVKTGLPLPSDEVFDLRKGARDYWEFGGTLGLGVVEADVSLHPVEIADAVLGFFFLDIRKDDLTFESLK